MTTTEAEYLRRINRVIDYIENNLDQPLPLEQLADVALFSKFHFHRVFYAMVRETPGQFVQRLRIEKAARLLLANRARGDRSRARLRVCRLGRVRQGVSRRVWRERDRVPLRCSPGQKRTEWQSWHSGTQPRQRSHDRRTVL